MSLKVTPLDRSYTSSYWRSIALMALSCIVSEIKRDINRKSLFFHIFLRSTHLLGGPRRNIVITFGTEKVKLCGYLTVKKFDDVFSRFDSIPACNRYLATA